MNDLQEMRDELAALRLEVADLKRRRWVSPVLLAAGLLAVGVTTVAAPTRAGQSKPADLVVSSLRVVGSDGLDKVTLGGDKDGGIVTVRGSDGKNRAVIAVDHDAGYTDWQGADGKLRATMFVSEAGMAEMHFVGADGKLRALLGQTKNGGFFAVRSNDDQNRVYLGVDNESGFADWYGNDAKLRESIYSTPDFEPQMKFIMPDGKLRILATAKASGGDVTVYDEGGNAKASIK